MSVPVIKTLLAAVIFCAGVIGATLPWLLRAKFPSERVMARADTFAGGVLGGAGLIHLLGGGVEGFREYAAQVHYPLALLLAGVGFLFVLLIENVFFAGPRDADDDHLNLCHELDNTPRRLRQRGGYAYILLLVLSVHSIIEGLALGAQQSLYGVMVVFVAIIAHKGVAGFALGTGYLRAHATWRRAAPGVAFFAAMAPLGILIGTSVGASISKQGAHLFNATFDSIGAGTFLYIAVVDILRTAFNKPDDRFAKWLAACLGFTLMAVLALWI